MNISQTLSSMETARGGHYRRGVMLFFAVVLFSGCHPAWRIKHPYERVDWKKHGQYQANFHTHTMVSDGWLNPQTVVAKYREGGYAILAISDHMAVTYPWEKFSHFRASEKTKKRIREQTIKPEEGAPILPQDTVFIDVNATLIGMVDIQAGELRFQGHDINSFFSDYHQQLTATTIDSLAEKGAIFVFNHPGRYRLPLSWYIDHFQRHQHLIGIEVFNCGNRYPHDRRLWDSLLTKLLPTRPIWGFSNDDMHSLRDWGRDWNVLILPKLDRTFARQAMAEGFFYFVHAPKGHKGVPWPIIKAIQVQPKKGTIRIVATATDSIIWISEGKRIHKGEQLRLQNLRSDHTYVRAELYGAGDAIVCTQPFYIEQKK